MKLGSLYSCVSTSLPPPLKRTDTLKLSSRLGLSDGWSFYTEPLRVIKVDSCQLTQRKLKGKVSLLRRPCILYATSEDESYNDLEPDNFEQESPNSPAKDDISEDTSSQLFERTLGKPGFISFYGHKQRSEDESPVSIPGTNRSDLLWFIGPTVLVASFVFPSLYLRRILTTIFEDSLLTDFLILFFTEALFYCGVAGFLFLVDQLRRPLEPVFAPTNWNPAPYFGNRIASVAVLVLSLTIPMVTMGFVRPWTGPAASATLAPYLVGIIVQFAFEQYAFKQRQVIKDESIHSVCEEAIHAPYRDQQFDAQEQPEVHQTGPQRQKRETDNVLESCIH